jgi:TolB protein
MKKMYRVLGLIVLLSLSLSGSWAQVDVVAGKVRVAVKPLSGAEGALATNVLASDLNRTLLIEAAVGQKQEKFTASGSFSGGVLTGRLSGQGGQTVLSKTYSGDWRRATHEFADDITLAVTGVKGFATAKVAFISNQSGKKELYVMDIDGGNLRQITRDNSISNAPSWNWQGTEIAYTSYKSGYPDVYKIQLASGARTRVAAFPGINSGAHFSPDGGKLALTLSKDGNPDIYVMPSAGGTPTRLTHTRGTETSPCWSPVGDRIVFSSDDRGAPQLCVVPAAGGEPSRLPTMSGFCTEPDWSPDGKKITYTLRAGGQFQIGVFDFDTRTAQQVTTGGGQNSSWTPNSRHVVYAHAGALYVLDTVTRLAKKLECGVKGCSEPSVTH